MRRFEPNLGRSKQDIWPGRKRGPADVRFNDSIVDIETKAGPK